MFAAALEPGERSAEYMTAFDKVRATGFHADLIEETVVRLNGGEYPRHMLYHLETTFDDESVFRHLDYLGLSPGRIIAFHLDEVAQGVRWVTNTIPLRNVDSIEVAQVLGGEADDPLDLGVGAPHLLVQLLFSTHLSLDLDRMQCDDPNCEFDHGLSGLIKHEGLAMRFFEGEPSGLSSTPDEAMDFVGALTAALARA